MENETNNNGVFIQDQEELTEEVNFLLFGKIKYEERQKEILKEVFE